MFNVDFRTSRVIFKILRKTQKTEYIIPSSLQKLKLKKSVYPKLYIFTCQIKLNSCYIVLQCLITNFIYLLKVCATTIIFIFCVILNTAQCPIILSHKLRNGICLSNGYSVGLCQFNCSDKSFLVVTLFGFAKFLSLNLKTHLKLFYENVSNQLQPFICNMRG